MMIAALTCVLLAAVPTPGPPVAALSRGAVASKLGSAPSCQSAVRLSKKSRTLQKNLEEKLAAAGLGRYTRRHQLSVAVVDLSRADEIYYAGVNDDDMMYAASLPKIAILLSVAEAANEGQIVWTPEFDQRLTAMITESSNTDATWGAELVGLGGIERAVRDPRFCLYDDVHGGLWVGRFYGPTPEEHREPLKDLSHAATARQAARFYTLLDNQELLSRDWSAHLLRLMGPPKHHHKFVRGLEGRAEVTFLARKSGTWQDWHADSALIQHGDERYVAVALSELKRGEDVMQQVIKVLDDLVVEGKHRRPRANRS